LAISAISAHSLLPASSISLQSHVKQTSDHLGCDRTFRHQVRRLHHRQEGPHSSNPGAPISIKSSSDTEIHTVGCKDRKMFLL